MIQANELRIGNWVQRIGWALEVVGIKENDVFLKCEDGTILDFYIFDGVEPIPLTEEWLVRFGFEKDKMFFEFSIHTIRINILLFPISTKNEEYQVKINNSTTQIFIKYVHQLQNLYFALTGEELELTNSNKSS